MKNAQNAFNLKRDLILYLVQPESFHFAWCIKMFTHSFMLCSMTRMSFSRVRGHHWYPTPWCHCTVWCPTLSGGITTAICMRTFAAILKAAAQNLQKKLSVTYPSRQLHCGSASSFKSLWKRTAHIIDDNVALLKYGRRNTESIKPTQSLLSSESQEWWARVLDTPQSKQESHV